MTFSALFKSDCVQLQNAVYRLELEIDINRLRQHVTLNRQMNCYKLKLECATVQIFLVSRSAMCFVRKTKVLPNVTDYGLVIKNSRLVTCVYTLMLPLKSVNLYKFYYACRDSYPNLDVEYEPEIFPCVTIKCFNVTMRVFRKGKAIVLGVKSSKQLVEPLRFLSIVCFDYKMTQKIYL